MRGSSVRLQAYLLRHALIGVSVALGVLAAVVMLIDLVEISKTIGQDTELTFFQLVYLTALKSPAVVLQLLPFIFLFGIMGAFASLNRRGELIAMRAAGVSAWRFTAPAAVGAVAIGLLAITVLNPAGARLNGAFEERKTALTHNDNSPDGGEIWLRQGDERRQIVIHARRHTVEGGTVRLSGVSLFVQSVGPTGTLDFSRRIEAAQAVLTPGAWRLTDVREAAPGATSTRSEAMVIPSSLDRRTAMEKFAQPGAIAFWDLPATIRSAELAGYSPAAYRLRYQQLLALPLMLAAMSVLAAAFSLRLMRLGDFARLAALGVAAGFAVFFLGQFCGALGMTEVIPAPLAAWAPPLIALFLGASLLSYTEDG